MEIRCRDCNSVFKWPVHKIYCPECAQIREKRIREQSAIRRKGHYFETHHTICPKCQQVMDKRARTMCKSCWYKWMQTRKPEDHPLWKGKARVSRGYKFVRAPWHPRAGKDGYIPEHILVWEKVSGMPVPEGWVVHHLNGIKADNRPKNLVAISRRHHASNTLLELTRKRVRELEVILAQLPLSNSKHLILEKF